ncbi:MAG TPA: (2Fe-2S)-binding protein [Paraburkholderia sp.]
MTRQQVTITVNGAPVNAVIEPRELLVHFLRDHAGMTGTHIGCDTSQCGACTVRMDGKTVKSCTVLAVQAQTHSVTTIEGLGTPKNMTPLQQAFTEMHGLQCGFCTPGMIFAAQALLDRVANPTEAQVREALHGNLCRCTGYKNIVDAVLLAASRANQAADDASRPKENA